MSRVGKKIIKCPANVQVNVTEGVVTVKGPKGELTQDVDPRVTIAQSEEGIQLSISEQTKELRAKHGLYRALIANMVTGVSEGFEVDLELVGIGYRAQLKGKSLSFALGFSHDVTFPAPEGVTFAVDGNTKIKVSGIDKQLVGQTVADMRGLRLPDAYKGKGIRLAGERLILKPGKSVKK